MSLYERHGFSRAVNSSDMLGFTGRKNSMLKAREGRYGLQPVQKSGRIIRPLGPEVCSSDLLLRKTVPQGLKPIVHTILVRHD
jgi:hypothetical protein